jgi:transcription termination/antitermination protein NusA
MNAELIRIVDGIARDKNIEREQIYTNIEQAIASALRKQFNVEETNEFDVKLDRITGDISANRQGEALPLSILGRIAAQTAKQVMIQLIRQDERGSIYEEYKDRVGTIITGTVARFEGPTLIISLGRSEGIMPRSEQIPGENHDVGERVQALILEVRDTPSAIKIILSRSHPEFIRKLFEREVPEVGEKTIELKALAREPGHRTKIAVSSIDSKVDAVGACVGVRGSRIKNIVDELGGEKIDIVRWNESSQILISNALKPAEVTEVSLCFELGRATVVVNEDQLSLAIGKRGQNVRLAARLTGWDVDILTPAEFQAGVKRLDTMLKSIEGVSQEHVDKVVALGLIDVRDIEEVGQEPLVELGLTEEVAEKVVERCAAEAKIVVVEQAVKKEADAKAKAHAQADSDKFLAALRGGGEAAVPAEPSSEQSVPGPMEAAEGGSPETIVHGEQALASSDDLSVEEEAISGIEPADDSRKEIVDEDDDTAALAEGRIDPPAASGDE